MASLWELIEDKTLLLQIGDEVYELDVDAIGNNIIILGNDELEDKLTKEEEDD